MKKIKIILLLMLFSNYCLCQMEISLDSSFENNQLMFNNIITKSIYKSLNNTDLRLIDKNSLLNFKFRIYKNTISDFQSNPGTKKYISDTIKNALISSIQTSIDSNLDLSFYDSSFILMPLIIVNRKSTNKNAEENVSLGYIEKMFNFDDVKTTVSIYPYSKWSLPFRTFVLHPITYYFPNIKSCYPIDSMKPKKK